MKSRSKPSRPQAIAEIRRWNSRRKHGHTPICGAKCRSTGEACHNTPMKNGRCRLHGGATPRGDKWHVRQWPSGSAPDAGRKFQRKLKNHQRAAKNLAERVAGMTPQQRESYDRWHSTHRPGSAADRKRKQADKRQAVDVAALLDNPPDVSDEAAALGREIAQLNAERERLRR